MVFAAAALAAGLNFDTGLRKPFLPAAFAAGRAGLKGLTLKSTVTGLISDEEEVLAFGGMSNLHGRVLFPWTSSADYPAGIEVCFFC